jgi:hypothetical protein
MAYSAKLWAQLKTGYESGEYASTEELYKKWSKNGQECPSLRQINRQSVVEGWKKGALKPQIELLTRENMLKALAKRGVNHSRLAEKIDGLLDAERAYVGKDGEVVTMADNVAVDKGITQAAKITGLYAPEQHENVTPEKLQKFIADVGATVVKFVNGEQKRECLDAIADIMRRYDGE